MPRKAVTVLVTQRQREVLEGWTVARTVSLHLQLRARIILLAAAGQPSQSIAEALGIARKTVGMWRNRWSAAFGRLEALEERAKDAAVERALVKTLSDDGSWHAVPSVDYEVRVRLLSGGDLARSQRGPDQPVGRVVARGVAGHTASLSL